MAALRDRIRDPLGSGAKAPNLGAILRGSKEPLFHVIVNRDVKKKGEALDAKKKARLAPCLILLSFLLSL
jgi:hypothetical protein